MSKFEFVTEYVHCGLSLPKRKTLGSAGYDLAAAEDIIIPSSSSLSNKIVSEWMLDKKILDEKVSLDQMAELTKKAKARPTLVPTGLKCKLDPGTYLELSVRSSSPLKYWLIMANGVGK
jgi:dUTP pyrophosphatase